MKHLIARHIIAVSLGLSTTLPAISSMNSKEISRPFVNVAKSGTPAVVFIEAEIGSGFNRFGYGPRRQDPYEFFNDDFFERFFGGRPEAGPQGSAPIQKAHGSGFIISEDGYVMTNYHVVKEAQNITVNLQNGKVRAYPAKFIGGDPQTDLAILKIENQSGEKFTYLEFGDSDELEVGEWVVAIGSPFRLESSVTAGIISAKGRQNLKITDLEDFIQTDAAINPGNSGGPLINLDGKVIAVNTAIASPSGGYVGIGFAIPSKIAMTISQQLMKNGKISRGFIGVSVQEIDDDLAEAFNLSNTQGALVADVMKNSPAEKAGIKQGDIITEVDGVTVRSLTSFRNEIMLKEPGQKVYLRIQRGKKSFVIPVEVANHSKFSSSPSTTKLGVTVDNISPEHISRYQLSPDDAGVVITDVDSASIAGRMGLKPGFVIIAVNHQKITNVKEFDEALKDTGQSKRVLLLVKYGDGVRFYSLKLP